MKRLVYKSGIDWWVWLIIIFLVGIAVFVVVDIDNMWVSFPLCGSLLFFVVLIFGCKYEIEGDDLVVYQFFQPHIFPISKIKEVKKTKGYLATAGMSSKRVSISFTDRSVLRSSMPLEISPKDRDGFMAKLKEINPGIDMEL